ncbi:TetR family transcriptional regulator [Lentzea guizhouensis]|uniref:TetR family transcriptional regulator n=1 Tax=Lentzea guizhouensis TaxID=1586287 RepID=A0A1B2HRL6_9PSEU|nr:TetR/AcrR family transcriptional regulator [Lentzea guizhouensis]ANZ40359.1 TetR family transcriptional regulator [Lentzea guizhouensis]
MTDARSRIVTAAAHLLRTGGAKAVTTRAVAQEAGIPAPTIFRLFGDKDGLLEAVAEQVMAEHVTAKAVRAADEDGDPVEDLRAAWRSHLAFGVAHPDVFLLLVDPARARHSAASAAGTEVLRARVARVAAAGLLNVSVARAVDLVHAAGSGAVLALLGKPEDQRDPGLADALLDAVLARILTSTPAPATDPMALVVAFREALPRLPALSDAERTLLSEWLTRTTDDLHDRRQH